MERFLTSGTVAKLCSNKVMLCAVLEYVYELACPIKINGEEYEGIALEFASQFANRFDLTMLVLEENKRSILYGIADSSDKPSDISPEEYYNGLITLVEALHKLTGNFTEKQKTSAYWAYKANSICDTILYYSVGTYMDEEFWDEKINRTTFNSFEEFRESLKEYIDYYFDEENVDTITEELLSYWKKEQKDDPHKFEDDEDEMVSYGWQLRETFSPEYLFGEIEECLDILDINAEKCMREM